MKQHPTNLTLDVEALVDKWPSAVVARSQVRTFSGGLISGRTIANLEAMGRGPTKIVVGHRVVYDARTLAEWLRDRSARG